MNHVWFLYLFNIKPLLDFWMADPFSHSTGCLFILWLVSLGTQNLFNLMQLHLSSFALVVWPFRLWVCVCMQGVWMYGVHVSRGGVVHEFHCEMWRSEDNLALETGLSSVVYCSIDQASWCMSSWRFSCLWEYRSLLRPHLHGRDPDLGLQVGATSLFHTEPSPHPSFWAFDNCPDQCHVIYYPMFSSSSFMTQSFIVRLWLGFELVFPMIWYIDLFRGEYLAFLFNTFFFREIVLSLLCV